MNRRYEYLQYGTDVRIHDCTFVVVYNEVSQIRIRPDLSVIGLDLEPILDPFLSVKINLSHGS